MQPVSFEENQRLRKDFRNSTHQINKPSDCDPEDIVSAISLDDMLKIYNNRKNIKATHEHMMNGTCVYKNKSRSTGKWIIRDIPCKAKIVGAIRCKLSDRGKGQAKWFAFIVCENGQRSFVSVNDLLVPQTKEHPEFVGKDFCKKGRYRPKVDVAKHTNEEVEQCFPEAIDIINKLMIVEDHPEIFVKRIERLQDVSEVGQVNLLRCSIIYQCGTDVEKKECGLSKIKSIIREKSLRDRKNKQHIALIPNDGKDWKFEPVPDDGMWLYNISLSHPDGSVFFKTGVTKHPNILERFKSDIDQGIKVGILSKVRVPKGFIEIGWDMIRDYEKLWRTEVSKQLQKSNIGCGHFGEFPGDGGYPLPNKGNSEVLAIHDPADVPGVGILVNAIFSDWCEKKGLTPEV